MGATNHLLTPSWYLSRGHGKGNWREILLCKGKNNYHSQLIHGKKYLYHSDGTKGTKDINSKYPHSFLTSILRTVGVFFSCKKSTANFCVKSLAQMSEKNTQSLERGWWQQKTHVKASKGVMLTLKKKKTYQKGYPKMNKYRPWKRGRDYFLKGIVHWYQLYWF